MANTVTSPNMNLPIPVQGTDTGPDYALNINSCLMTLDGHDHSAGNGVAITPGGINISSDLPFGSNNATQLRSTRFSSQAAVLALGSDLDCLYVVSKDLYYNDGDGNHVRITQSGGVAGSPGSISNLTSPASAAYVSANQTFVWQSDSNVPANLDAASIIIRNLSASSKGLTLNPPSAMGADYSLTLPSLPAATNFVTLTSAGALAGGVPISLGIDTSNIASNAITTAKITDLNVTTAKIADSAVTTAKINDGAVTPAKLSARSFVTSTGTGNASLITTTGPVTGLVTPALVTTGRPVVVALVPDGSSTNTSLFQFTATSGGNITLTIDNGSVVIAKWLLNIPPGTTSIFVPVSAFQFITNSVGVAGSYAFTFNIAVMNGSGTPGVFLLYTKLISYEL